MFDHLSRRIVSGRVTLGREIAWGLGSAAVAGAIRWAVDPILIAGTPFILFVPSVLAASIFAGWRAGLMCVTLCSGLAVAFIVDKTVLMTPRAAFGEVAFIVVSLVTVWLAGSLRAAITQLQTRDRQQRLLVSELQHRVKNSLAIVQAITQQTLRSTSDPAQIKRDLTERLVALGQAHNLVVDASRESVDLAALARNALQPFAGDQALRISIAGPPAEVPADLAISIALCLHELATNAIKHGALSQPAGRVSLAWSFDPQGREARGGEPRVCLCWREHGGPLVIPPTRAGFGSRLLKRGLSGRVRPVVRLDFAPEGLAWTADFDISPPAHDFYKPGPAP